MHFGRVAVMHVQGSPKDGGALGPPMVLSTRLTPVPPTESEALMLIVRIAIYRSFAAWVSKVQLIIGAVRPLPARWNIGDIRTWIFILLAVAPCELALAAPQKKSEPPFDPAIYCNNPGFQAQMPVAMRLWGEEVGEDTAKNGKDFIISNAKVQSYEEGQSVVCRVTISFTNSGRGGHIYKLVETNADFIIYGNDDGSKTFVAPFHWPTAEELKVGTNSYNRNLIVDGETFQQAWDKKKDAGPKNVLEAMVGAQQAYEAQTDVELRRQGYGEMLDKEKARRARLTPAQRAKEDAWNRGPAPGETLCIEEAGVKRCKTGER